MNFYDIYEYITSVIQKNPLIVAIIGGLVGAFITHLLTTRRELRVWKRQRFFDGLSNLTVNYHDLLKLSAELQVSAAHSKLPRDLPLALRLDTRASEKFMEGIWRYKSAMTDLEVLFKLCKSDRDLVFDLQSAVGPFIAACHGRDAKKKSDVYLEKDEAKHNLEKATEELANQQNRITDKITSKYMN